MFRTFVGFTIVAAAGVLVSAQTASRIPRMPDGKPDLQGMYDLAMLTPVERPNALPAVLTDEQAAKLEKQDRKSTRLNSSHLGISYAVFCLKKKNTNKDLY